MTTLNYRDPVTGKFVRVPVGGGGGSAPNEVVVSDTEPTDAATEWWINPSGTPGVPAGSVPLTQADADARYVNIDGDAMTGMLNIDSLGVRVRQLGTGTPPQAGAVHGVWAGGVLIQSFDDRKADPDKSIDVLRSDPAGNTIKIGTADPNQNEQRVILIGKAVAQNKDGTAFTPVWPDHVATKGYVDARAVVPSMLMGADSKAAVLGPVGGGLPLDGVGVNLTEGRWLVSAQVSFLQKLVLDHVFCSVIEGGSFVNNGSASAGFAASAGAYGMVSSVPTLITVLPGQTKRVAPYIWVNGASQVEVPATTQGPNAALTAIRIGA